MATNTATAQTGVSDDYFDLVRRFPLVPIRDGRHLAAAHLVIDELSILGDDGLTGGRTAYLAVLCDLTTAYEAPAAEAMTRGVTGLDVLTHLVEANDLTAADVGRIVGRPDAGADLLAGRCPIARADAVALGGHFRLPHETFLR